MKPRRAFTLVELLVVIAILGLLMSILIPSLGRAKEAVRQAKCRTQLRGFANSLHSYAAEMNDKWPCVAKVGGTKIDTSASLWLLVIHGNALIDDFICPTDEVAGRVKAYRGVIDPVNPFPMVNLAGVIDAVAAKNTLLSLSYSYQVPHSVTGNPGQDHLNATHFAVMADRNPYDTPRTPAPSGKLINSLAGCPAGTAPAGDPTQLKAITGFIFNLPLNYSAATSRTYINSVNHNGEGQNVLYRDGHVEWQPTPLAGINADNIYTRRSSDSTVSGVSFGTAPDTGGATPNTALPYSNDDSYLRTVHSQ